MEHNSVILVVDDELYEREIIAVSLTDQGYKLVFAGNGTEALAKAAEITPDLILLDVIMPGMDGFEVCRRLRADPLLAEVPIVMITALGDHDSRLQGIEAGADDFLTKPFDQSELQARVRTVTQINRYRQLLLANRQLEHKIAQISALYDISSKLSSTLDVEAILRSVIQKAKELLNAESVSILLWDQRRDALYLPIGLSGGEKTAHQKQPHFPIVSSVSDWVLREGRSALVRDMNTDERFSGKNTGDEDTKEREASSGVIKTVLCVPLRGRERILGVLEAVNTKNGEFTADDQHLLEAMAGNITVSIEKADLYQNLQRAEALLRRQNAVLRQAVKQKYRFENIIGNSDEIISVIKKAEQVALTDSTVVIYGETGTGKELLAQAIYQNSPRAMGNFVSINCGAIPESLLESELFGHEKGAFTGAAARRIGRFEEADGGTLFLDEIGDMSLSLQVKLLRVLEEGVIQRLGSNQDIPVDVRVIVATHHNLAQLVAERGFRQDLYYRLKVFELELPPLRERRADIPLLINHFVVYYNKELNRHIVGIDVPAMNILCEYDYPGNVRELRHIIESAMVLCKGDMITLDVLPKGTRTWTTSDSNLTASEERLAIPKSNEELKAAKTEARQRAEDRVERLFLTELLSSTHGKVTEAAERIGMNRSRLSQLISKHGLDLSRFRSVLPDK